MDAGLDWTGTPSLNEAHPYGPCIVAVDNRERFDTAWNLLVAEAGIARGAEIKGHKSPPRVLADVLRLVLANETRVGVLLLEKQRAISTGAIWPLPAVLRHQTALQLAEEMMQETALSRLLCDEEIRGRREQQQFKTAVLRCNHQLQSGNKMKLGFWPSDKSNLIQCADVVAYVAARSLRTNGLTAELKTLWRQIQAQPQSKCSVLQEWGD